MPATLVEGLADDLEAQRRFLEQRVPSYARVLAELSSLPTWVTRPRACRPSAGRCACW